MTKKLDSISREIRVSFNFLFEKGYKLQEADEFGMGGWRVILSSPDMAIVFFLWGSPR